MFVTKAFVAKNVFGDFGYNKLKTLYVMMHSQTINRRTVSLGQQIL